jgi:hypothetical protein
VKKVKALGRARAKPAARSKPCVPRARGIRAALKSDSFLADRETETSAARILILEKQLVDAPANSRRRREVTKLIRAEAAVYRRSLDDEQTTAMHDPHGFKL